MEIGTRLGPYELVSRIGAGGMGEVYKARDTRLDRAVAIKILPPEFARDSRLKIRFEREARTISQLTHPNICTLHDVGHENGTDFLVMELVEGETLADRISRGPMPLSEVIGYGAQIADALDRAHRASVVHRDLKPANVMITKSGAKLLDFGLAKAAAHVVSGDDATQQRGITQEGTILGTFQYMAPEQLEGAEADPRTDIFALGSILYEMATGRRAFEGKTRTSLIAAIVSSHPPPLSQVQPLTPPALDHVVAKCLAKDPDGRWQSAHDVAEELRWIGEAGSQAGVASPVMAKRIARARLLLGATIVFALLSAAGIGATLVLVRRLHRIDRVVTAEISPAAGQTLAGVNYGTAALSPDGSKLAYLVMKAGSSTIWIQDLKTGEAKPLAGTEDGHFPFWSPDGTRIGFFSKAKLKTIAAAGGSPQTVCDAAQGRGGSWNSDDVIIFAPNIRAPLVRVSAAGGRPEPVTKTARAIVSHRMPHFLPDGNHFVYVERDTAGAPFGSIVAGALDDPTLKKVVLTAASNAAYADGMLLYRRDGTLFAQSFDTAELAVKGSAKAVAEQVEYYNPRDIANFSVSTNGRLVYRQSNVIAEQLVTIDAEGRDVSRHGHPDYYERFTVSRDNRTIAFIRKNASETESDVWVMDLARGASSRVTFGASPTLKSAAIAPDGSSVVYADFGSYGGARSIVVRQSLGAAGEQRELARSLFPVVVFDWSPDGRYVVAAIQESATAHDIYAMDVHTGALVPILRGKQDEIAPRISPDGRWLVYASDESGRPELFVTTFPKAGRRWQVSTLSSSVAAWSADGQRLLFESGGKSYSVTVTVTDRGLELGTPAQESLPVDAVSLWHPLPDNRYLALKRAADARPTPLRVVLNWPNIVNEK